ncbi:hypothetical protein FRAHR75_130010 [Frankia sp. Hr75.2]|nr:hypothetical protein FRAHR75_130010 [Frankia sp. Hr75.2]
MAGTRPDGTVVAAHHHSLGQQHPARVDTTPRPAVSTRADEYTAVVFTAKVLLGSGRTRASTTSILPGRSTFLIPGAPSNNSR